MVSVNENKPVSRRNSNAKCHQILSTVASKIESKSAPTLLTFVSCLRILLDARGVPLSYLTEILKTYTFIIEKCEKGTGSPGGKTDKETAKDVVKTVLGMYYDEKRVQ